MGLPILTLGIDPGTLITGYGVVRSEGSSLFHVASGSIRTSAGDPLPKRLKTIYDGVVTVLELHRPHQVAVENIFHSKNVQSALKLGHARGVAILAAVNHNLDIAEYLPTAIKKAVTGVGGADKEQVQKMVQVLLRHPAPRGYDASDALAVAICHIYSLKMTTLLARMKESS